MSLRGLKFFLILLVGVLGFSGTLSPSIPFPLSNPSAHSITKGTGPLKISKTVMIPTLEKGSAHFRNDLPSFPKKTPCSTFAEFLTSSTNFTLCVANTAGSAHFPSFYVSYYSLRMQVLKSQSHPPTNA